MADITPKEQRILERVLNMGDGYVLNFSNASFRNFVESTVNLDPYDGDKYTEYGESKANRLRAIWKIEPDYIVAKLLKEMLEYLSEQSWFEHTPEYDKAVQIAAHLSEGTHLDLDALEHPDGAREFELLRDEVREAIARGKPEAGLDRLHTFTVKLFKHYAETRGVETDKDKPLHSIVGEYRKKLHEAGLIESPMTDRIMKSAIGTFEEFNHVRNNRTLVHDNSVLNYDEAMLIFGHVCGIIRFVRSLEEKTKPEPEPEPEPDDAWLYSDEIPF